MGDCIVWEGKWRRRQYYLDSRDPFHFLLAACVRRCSRLGNRPGPHHALEQAPVRLHCAHAREGGQSFIMLEGGEGNLL